ncbi:glycosyltransferase family 4 protein [Mesorhizobium sp. M1273]|uniref:glycosyltransferase family 4 protein n=1 Tax=unclassified Mesorhizobium TaxID=325217 RepID=UPI00333BFD1D
MLALVAEAFGGYGGIAQSTQDLLSAISFNPAIDKIEVLPRIVRDQIGDLPEKITQHPAIWNRFSYSVVAWRLMSSTRPKIVYCGHVFLAPLAAALARAYGAKLVVHVHGLEVWGRLNLARRWALRMADMALCVSNDTRDRLVVNAGLSAERAEVIYNTYSDRFVLGDRTAAREAVGFGSEIVLLTVSRLDANQRHKGHDQVISQISLLRSRGNNVIYVIAGDGDDSLRLQQVAKSQGVDQYVRFLGRVPAEQLPSLYLAADIYVMPSSREGFGIAFIEAMACGTLAIGLAIGGATEALCAGELGMAGSPEDFPKDLALAIERLPIDRHLLASRTKARFGIDAFRSRVNVAMTRFIK